jgi:hypothetical protein
LRQVHGGPEKYPIKVLTPDRSDQPFDERMRDRSVRKRLDLVLAKNVFGVEIGLQMIAAEFMGGPHIADVCDRCEMKILGIVVCEHRGWKCSILQTETGARRFVDL